MYLIFYFIVCYPNIFFFFFFNDTATTEIYTLSLHDALPICNGKSHSERSRLTAPSRSFLGDLCPTQVRAPKDRKSTRLNSSHLVISYAVFCLKKKKISQTEITTCSHCLL